MTDASKSRSLILITNHYPFGLGESFLENEIGFLTSRFDTVIVVARDVTSQGIREVKGFKYYRINPESSFAEKLVAFGLLVRKRTSLLSFVREEFAALKRTKRKKSFAILRVMFHDAIKAITTAWHIEKIIRANQLRGTVTLYSYWLTSSALAATLVRANDLTLKRISRAHGGDVHEYRSALKYLSFRTTLAAHLDHIYCISDNSTEHLKRFVPENLHPKITTARLGTFHQESAAAQRNPAFTIVSCAFMVSVKRIPLLIEALSKIDDVQIEWIHIGDGPERAIIERAALALLMNKKNIHYMLKGSMSNAALMEFYRTNHVDLFINTSSSEGIPVTMMEAQSFGIPVLAPSIGGIPEIVDARNGGLFPVDASADEIAQRIKDMISLDQKSIESLRTHAFENWKSKFSAEHNFSIFAAEILKL